MNQHEKNSGKIAGGKIAGSGLEMSVSKYYE